MALLLTSVFSVTGCGSDDGEAPVESRIKNFNGTFSGGGISGPETSPAQFSGSGSIYMTLDEAFESPIHDYHGPLTGKHQHKTNTNQMKTRYTED